MLVSFTPESFAEYTQLQSEDRKLAKRINKLVKDIMRNPCAGVGKPEPLKHNLKGYWSRRIDKEHRLVYRVVDDQEVRVTQCKEHY